MTEFAQTDEHLLDSFRTAMRHVAATVYAVTTGHGGGRYGILATAQSSLICRRAHCHEFGTHSIFIGELVAAKHRADAAPLTYYDRHYIDISEAPESAAD